VRSCRSHWQISIYWQKLLNTLVIDFNLIENGLSTNGVSFHSFDRSVGGSEGRAADFNLLLSSLSSSRSRTCPSCASSPWSTNNSEILPEIFELTVVWTRAQGFLFP